MILKGLSPCLIGERINPTSKKQLTEEIRQGECRWIQQEARRQEEAGVDAIDVNVGVPGIEEGEAMRRAVRAIRAVSKLPLFLDSPRAETLAAGLREAQDRVILNSVTGACPEATEQVFRMAREHGADVVALTLDKRGVSTTWRDRVAVGRSILGWARSQGLPEENLIMDPLTTPVRKFPGGVQETLFTIRALKEELGVMTCIGLSNISYGLEERSRVNAQFLGLALISGIDMVILDPLDDEVMSAAKSGRSGNLTEGAIRRFVEAIQ